MDIWSLLARDNIWTSKRASIALQKTTHKKIRQLIIKQQQVTQLAYLSRMQENKKTSRVWFFIFYLFPLA